LILCFCNCEFHILCYLTTSLQKVFRRKDGELSVFGRLAAGACAGMTSTLVMCLFIYVLAKNRVFLVLLVRCGNTA
jgi:uncharacterized membrane protein